MTNNSEVDVSLVSKLQGQGFDQLQSQLAAAKAEVDNYQASLVQKFNAGKISVEEFTSEIKASSSEIRNFQVAVDQVTGANDKAGASYVNLASQSGLTRRELGLAVTELGNVTGASSAVTSGLGALAMGFGPVGVGAIATVEALKAYTDWLDKAAKKQIELAQAQARPEGVAQTNFLIKAEDKQKIADLTTEGDALAKQIASIESAMSSGDARTRSYATSALAAAGGMDYLKGKLTEIESEIAFLNNKDIFSSAQANQLVTFTEQADRAATAVDDLTAALTRNNQQRAQFSSSGFQEETAQQGENAARQAEMAANMQRWSKEALDAKAAESKAASQYQAEMLKMADLNQMVAFASTQMTGVQVANMQMIVNSTGDANTKMAELRAYISSLSNAKQIDLAIQFKGNTDLMSLLGLGGATPGGRDFTKEAGETFSQQSSKVQSDAVNAAGGDKSKAADDWAKRHMAELTAELLRDPKQFVNTGVFASVQAAAAMASSTGAASTVAAAATAVPTPVNTQAATQQGTQTGSAITQGMSDKVSQAKLSTAVATSISADLKALTEQGLRVGAAILDGVFKQARDSDFINTWARMAVPELSNFFEPKGAFK